MTRSHAAFFCMLAMMLEGCAIRQADYETPSPSRPVIFPRDHYAHHGYPIEWWYYFGRLTDEEGRSHGFHVSFFQRRTDRDRMWGVPLSWYANPAYFVHCSTFDLATGRYRTQEIIGSPRWGTAEGREDKLEVRVKDCFLREQGNDYVIRGRAKGQKLELQLRPRKPVVTHGQGGYTPTSPAGSAVYYSTITRLDAKGTLRTGSRVSNVQGQAWMDHEVAGPGMLQFISGWDWMALQLDDGNDLVLIDCRRRDSLPNSTSFAALIAPDGSVKGVQAEDIKRRSTGTWRSPHSGALYPSGWEIAIQKLGVRLTVTPLAADQEFNGHVTGLVYWEGHVRVGGVIHQRKVGGWGLVELFGYKQPRWKL